MAGVSVPEPPARPLASSVLGVAIIAITGMQLMSTLDGTIVIVALPRMQAELGLSDAGKSWVITAYVLTFGGLLLLGGRVGDAIGHKRAFISGVGAVLLGIAFLIVERSADNPLVPLSMFNDRNRVMTFVSLFLAGGVMLSLTVMIGLYVQDVLGYSALHAGIGFIPFAVALGLGNVITARLAPHIAPRWLIIGGGFLVLGAMLFGSTLTRTIPYFPDLLLPILIGGFGIGVISVILPLCAVAEVGPSEIGPVSAVTLMVQNLGGPVVLVVIQAVQTSRTLYLGGTTGPVADMTSAQLDALDAGYTYSLLWIAAVAILVGVSAFFIGFSAPQIAAAQHTRDAVEAGEI